MRERLKNIKKLNILWVIALFEILYLALYIWVDGKNLLDSDLSGEMVLASILNRDKELILAKNWFYTTELRVLNMQLYYRVFLLLFPTHWRIARMCSVVAMHLTLIGSIHYFTRKLGIKDIGPVVAVLCLCPFGGEYNWIITIGCCYTIPVAIAFFVPAFIEHISKSEIYKIKSRDTILFLVLFILSYTGGMAGIRHLMICSAPVFGAYILLFCRQYIRGDIISAKCELVKKIILSFSMLIISFIGYITNVKILSKYYSFQNISGSWLSDFDLSKMINKLGELCGVLGYRPGEAFSMIGVQAGLAMILFFMLIISFGYFFIRMDRYNDSEFFAVSYTGLSLLIGVVSISLTDWSDPRYAIPGLMLAFVAIGLFWDKFVLHRPDSDSHNTLRYPRIKLVSQIALILIVVLYCIKPNMVFYKSQNTRNLREAISFLMENGYSKGYASLFNGTTQVELSNGQLEVWVMNYVEEQEEDGFKILEFSQDKKHLYNYPEGRIYVLLDTEENALNPPYALPDHLVYDSTGFFIYEYDSVQELYATLD